MFKRFSWIIASLALYFAGLAFYMLRGDDNDSFWVGIFYCLNAYLVCLGLAFNFKKKKTHNEMSVIAFVLAFRLLLLVYYIISDFILHGDVWMNASIRFWCMMGIAGFIGMVYNNKKVYGTEH